MNGYGFGVDAGMPAELRADATSLAISALFSAASGIAAKTWAAGAVECCAGLWARALSVATPNAPDLPIGPAWLAEVARDVARQGEAVYLFDVTLSGRTRLLRASIVDVDGDSPDPLDWIYRLTISGPRTSRTVTVAAPAVVHVRYATERSAPARGMSPLAYASLTGSLTASLEQSLGYEAAGPVANLIALPHGFSGPRPNADGTIPEDEPNTGGALAESIRTAKGRTLLPESTADNWGGDPTVRPPKRDLEPVRLGASPPQALVMLRQHVECSVLACYGVPAPLGPMGVNDGTAQREALRRFRHLTIQPLANLIAAELTRVLERPVSLGTERLQTAAELTALARAVHVLTQAEPERIAEARRIIGWE